MKWILLATLVACASDPDTPVGPQPTGDSCGGMTQSVPSEAAIHVAVGTDVQWSTNPPVTGEHYQIWGAYDRSYTALDRGYYLHDAEHGAIVLLYNCPDGCPDVVAQLEDVTRDLDDDPSCTAPVRNRSLVTGDPLLPDGIQVAAVAWDNLYTATCFDPYVKTFAHHHYGFGPEDLCADGANLGGTFIDP
ncbi:MAG: DUF3105 domain-containing protein [Kofleriaceae bacterium]